VTRESFSIRVRDEELLEAREEEYRKLRKVQAVCTFTVYGPLAEFVNSKMKDRSFIRDICGLKSESELMNAIIFIFKVIADALGPRIRAYLRDIVENICKHREDKAKEIVETMIADAFSRPLSCPKEAVDLYTDLKQCLGDIVNKILQSSTSPDETCLELYYALQTVKEAPGIASMLNKILKEIQEIKKILLNNKQEK